MYQSIKNTALSNIKDSLKTVKVFTCITISLGSAFGLFLLIKGIVGEIGLENSYNRVIDFFDELILNSKYFYKLNLPEDVVEEYIYYYEDIVSGYIDAVNYMQIYVLYTIEIIAITEMVFGALLLYVYAVFVPICGWYFGYLVPEKSKKQLYIKKLIYVLIVLFGIAMLLILDFLMVAFSIVAFVWIYRFNNALNLNNAG